MKDKVNQYDLLREMIAGLRREMALKDQQLILQAKEYERRLLDLNHENDRIKEVQKLSVLREVFDRETGNINAKTQINTDYINTVKGKGTGMNSLWVIAVAAVLGICAVVTVIIVILTYLKK
jgi:hypothetical protein